MKPALRILFWVVVAASLFSNAVLLGLWLRAAGLRDTLNGGGDGLAGLPGATLLDYRAALFDQRPALSEKAVALGKARRALFEAAVAEAFDRTLVAARMAEMLDASAALQASAQAILLDVLDPATNPR
jgi:hypothetical protein